MSKDEAKASKKVAESIRRNDMASARIHGENAIRAKTEGLAMLRLSARIGAVASRVESALRMKALTSAMTSVTKGMDTVLGSMDAAKISKMMDKFEDQFEALDARVGVMGEAIDSATGTAAPVSDVDELIAQVAASNTLELKGEFAEIPAAKAAAAAAPAPAAAIAAGLPAPPAGGGGGAGGSSGGGAGGDSGGGAGGLSVADSLQARLDALRG